MTLVVKTSLELDLINYTPNRGLGSAMAYFSDSNGKDIEHTDGHVATEAIKLWSSIKTNRFLSLPVFINLIPPG